MSHPDNNTNFIGLEWRGSATDIIEMTVVDITIVVTREQTNLKTINTQNPRLIQKDQRVFRCQKSVKTFLLILLFR